MMNVTYPAEIQIKGKSQSGGTVTFVYLFEVFDREDNDFLIELGLGKGKVKEIKPFKETHEQTVIKTDISLFDLAANKPDYLMYEGQSLFDDCEPSLVFVSKDLSWMSKLQFDEIKGVQKIKETSKKPLNTILYQNFERTLGSIPYVIDGGYPTRPKFPSSFRHDLYMYSPKDNDTLILIGPQEVPGWEVPQGQVYYPTPLPSLPYGLKYLPLYYEPIYRSDFAYIPRYIIVDKSFNFDMNLQPATLKILIRREMPERPSMMRPLVWLDVGVVRIDPELLQAWEKELLNREIEEKKRKAMEAEKKQKEAEEKKKKEEAEKKEKEEQAKKKAEEEEHKRKKLLEEEAKKGGNTKSKKECVKWSLQSILNRYFAHDHAWDLKGVWKGGNGDHYTCVEWKIVPQVANIAPTHTARLDDKKPVAANASAPVVVAQQPQVNKKKCTQYIDVVLNKNWRDADFKDLVLSQCRNETESSLPKPANGSTTKGLAQVGMQEYQTHEKVSHPETLKSAPLEV